MVILNYILHQYSVLEVHPQRCHTETTLRMKFFTHHTGWQTNAEPLKFHRDTIFCRKMLHTTLLLAHVYGELFLVHNMFNDATIRFVTTLRHKPSENVQHS